VADINPVNGFPRDARRIRYSSTTPTNSVIDLMAHAMARTTAPAIATTFAPPAPMTVTVARLPGGIARNIIEYKINLDTPSLTKNKLKRRDTVSKQKLALLDVTTITQHRGRRTYRTTNEWAIARPSLTKVVGGKTYD
jgi:hypothetical protein